MSADIVEVDLDVLHANPLPDHGSETDKNARGVVLVVGGSAETTGAVVLAGLAALRVGAGKLQLATVCSGRAPIAAAVAEARVVGLGETSSGAIDPRSATDVSTLAADVDALVLGTGTIDAGATIELRDRVLANVDGLVTVLDAGALGSVDGPLSPQVVLMPNPAEMTQLLGSDVTDPCAAVREACERFDATVALRGSDTWITAPGHPVYVHRAGHPGLATSGSGDVLAGALGGLAARGADPLVSTLWAIALHAAAGRRAAERIAPMGFLARELLDELPIALDESQNNR